MKGLLAGSQMLVIFLHKSFGLSNKTFHSFFIGLKYNPITFGNLQKINKPNVVCEDPDETHPVENCNQHVSIKSHVEQHPGSWNIEQFYWGIAKASELGNHLCVSLCPQFMPLCRAKNQQKEGLEGFELCTKSHLCKAWHLFSVLCWCD